MGYFLGHTTSGIVLLLLGFVFLSKLSSEISSCFWLSAFRFLYLHLFFFLRLKALTLLADVKHELRHAAGVLLSIHGLWLHFLEKLGLGLVVQGDDLRIGKGVLLACLRYVINSFLMHFLTEGRDVR